jgi:hypothetical protein
MSISILIDGKGSAWPDRSWDLARRLGYRHPTLDLAAYAVQKRGFVHLRERDRGARIALRAGRVRLAAVLGAMVVLHRLQPRRILLAVAAQGEWSYEIFASLHDFGERAEQLVADGPVEPRAPWLAIDRGTDALVSPLLAPLRRLLGLWEAERGRLPDDIDDRVAGLGLRHRMILARRQGRSRLVFEQFGSALEMVPAGERASMVGRGFGDLPDPAYGAWIEEAYAATANGRHPRLASMQARFRQSATTQVGGRCVRLLLPWRGRGGELFAMGTSLTRAVSSGPLDDLGQPQRPRVGGHP